MIHLPSPDWVIELQSSISNPRLLCEQLELPTELVPEAERVSAHFPLRVTPSFVSRMRTGDPEDPLLKQVLPLGLEEKVVAGFSKDPLNEKCYNPVPGLLHKYIGRALITIVGSCAIHCRYCFRRHFPYKENTPGRKLDKILDYLSTDLSIREVILSGGDPLITSDAYLAHLLGQLAAISHLKIVRVHTRLPIVLPSRINGTLIAGLTHTRLKPVLVMHCNHPQEIDSAVTEALQKLSKAGVTLLNQSVLLNGINDTAEVLAKLSYRLFECQVMPYYLHLLDKVQGAAHFEVERDNARQLYCLLRAQLPGYLVPLLVEEKPGASSKLPVF
jgi:L-lysine 2,3-aminomutase